ncbi:TadE family type IV pilus minor pilin [Streptomyces sp. NPDC059740]|uniref:TadE family type IV pilus minor pilin n=1 Tax=Streptomyces sp. NPDC059740 TaxID=3346926 RepID=UPI003656560B
MTAEAAAVTPVLVMLIAFALWAIGAAADQIRCVDAARAGARAAARAEPEEKVLEVARSAAPDKARIAVSRKGRMVTVTVRADRDDVLRWAVELGAEATADAEDTAAA